MPKITGATIAEHRERTYEALLKAVDELATEQGFDAMSMQDIAHRAGVARTAIYNYAEDRSALLLAAAHRRSAELNAGLAAVLAEREEDAASRLRSLVHGLLVPFARTVRGMLVLRTAREVLSGEHKRDVVLQFRRDIGGFLRSVLEQGIDDGSFAPSDVELTVALATGVLEAAIDRVSDRPEDALRIAETTDHFLQHALGADGAR